MMSVACAQQVAANASETDYQAIEIPGGTAETKGAKLETMRLRGTQFTFVDTEEKPTILANSPIEHGFQPNSSCLTCHSRAGVA